VRVLADVVGIITAGKLVREGTLDFLLRDQGLVRARVPRAQLADARAVLERVAKTDGDSSTEGDPWLAVHVEPNRAGEINRVLAEAGIFASGLESGTDLEMLFLELTGGGQPSKEGSFRAIATPVAPGSGAADADGPAA
jgi:ABC-type multidrug transport system ATPase subunit